VRSLKIIVTCDDVIIDIIISNISGVRSGRVNIVGSGFGGTIQYLNIGVGDVFTPGTNYVANEYINITTPNVVVCARFSERYAANPVSRGNLFKFLIVILCD
jgi:hypothetical protein